jgi:hypothetical protein
MNKSEIAKQLGKLGGQATAKRGSDFYRQIGAKGKLARQKKKLALK